ncbi:Hypothetical protein D9617_2g056820 [Elsinoe fawcettii]|nr:Hypothetical protein D9617_2g056820 [Elsinoe fawcettii]
MRYFSLVLSFLFVTAAYSAVLDRQQDAVAPTRPMVQTPNQLPSDSALNGQGSKASSTGNPPPADSTAEIMELVNRVVPQMALLDPSGMGKNILMSVPSAIAAGAQQPDTNEAEAAAAAAAAEQQQQQQQMNTTPTPTGPNPAVGSEQEQQPVNKDSQTQSQSELARSRPSR